MRSHPARLLVVACFAAHFCAAPALAQWAPGGVLVSGGSAGPAVLVAADGAGGAIAVWGGNTVDEYFYNIRYQHLSALGYLASGYPTDGRKASSQQLGDQYISQVLSDGLGGWFLIWIDLRYFNHTAYDLFAQHVLADGTLDPRWPADGAPVAVAHSYQWYAIGIADGAGGLLVVWDDERANLHDMYAVKLDASGQVAPGWPVNGRPLVGPVTTRIFSAHGVPDGFGGQYLQWSEPYGGPHVLRITPDGDPWPGWPVAGLRVSSIRAGDGVASDGHGGAYVPLITALPNGQDSSYYLQHILPSSEIDPAWPPNGSPVCYAPVFRNFIQVYSDGVGGALMKWLDYREGYPRLYALRMLADGSRAPGWPENGKPVVSFGSFQDAASNVVTDGSGGAFIASGSDANVISTAFVQHLGGNGSPAPGWPGEGLILSPHAGDRIAMATDGSLGAIVAWVDQLTQQVYAQRYVFDGIVAAQLALVSSDARPDRVVLLWQGTGAAGLNASVERREASGAWRRLGPAERDAADRVRYEDASVTAGTRYAYRLVWTEDGAEQATAESWIDVPGMAVLALEGLRPNPAVDAINVSFSLPGSAAASLELLDLAGRRVADREVGSLGAGRHLVRLDQAARVAPGIYWVRLKQGGRQFMVRAAVVR